MGVSAGPAKKYRFEGFTLDLVRGALLRDEEEIPLRNKSFALLQYLVEHYGRLISKDELIGEIWPDTFVGDDALARCLMEVRRALGETGQSAIKTIPRRGYLFDATVEEVLEPSEGPDVQRPRVWVLGAVAGIGIAVAAAAMLATGGDGATGGIRSVAVLPLENLSRDPEQEFFADGMTEALISQLAQVPGLRVPARTSIMRYKNTDRSLPQIARELSVDAVLEGTVVHAGQRVRITLQLIEAETDRHLWAEVFDRDLSDVLLLQAEVAAGVARRVDLEVSSQGGTRPAFARSVSPKAHIAYLRGMHLLGKLTLDGSRQAVAHFEQALAHDPGYALAYRGLAEAYTSMSTFYVAPSEVMPRARAAAEKALQLDSSLAEARSALGIVKLFYDWDWTGAEREFQTALSINPNLAEAHRGYASLMAAQGRFEAGSEHFDTAQSLDPLPIHTRGEAFWFPYVARRYQDAIDDSKAFLELEPSYFFAYVVMALSYSELSRHEEAVQAARTARRLSDSPLAAVKLAYVLAATGEQAEARDLARQLAELANRQYLCANNIALVYVALGEIDVAFEWFERAFRERSD